jgi:hypothetical protein
MLKSPVGKLTTNYTREEKNQKNEFATVEYLVIKSGFSEIPAEIQMYINGNVMLKTFKIADMWRFYDQCLLETVLYKKLRFVSLIKRPILRFSVSIITYFSG